MATTTARISCSASHEELPECTKGYHDGGDASLNLHPKCCPDLIASAVDAGGDAANYGNRHHERTQTEDGPDAGFLTEGEGSLVQEEDGDRNHHRVGDDIRDNTIVKHTVFALEEGRGRKAMCCENEISSALVKSNTDVMSEVLTEEISAAIRAHYPRRGDGGSCNRNAYEECAPPNDLKFAKSPHKTAEGKQEREFDCEDRCPEERLPKRPI